MFFYPNAIIFATDVADEPEAAVADVCPTVPSTASIV
jgi:hypothetical protein